MSAAIINKFMGMLGINNKEDEEEDTEEYEDENVESMTSGEEDIPKSAYRPRRSFREIDNESPYSLKNSQAKILPMNTAISSKVVITQPTCYDDVQEIGEYLKGKKAVIINLESINKEDARRVLDFLSGATFIVDGTIQKVSNLIYLMTPRNVEIQNDAERNQYKQKMSFSWLK